MKRKQKGNKTLTIKQVIAGCNIMSLFYFLFSCCFVFVVLCIFFSSFLDWQERCLCIPHLDTCKTPASSKLTHSENFLFNWWLLIVFRLCIKFPNHINSKTQTTRTVLVLFHWKCNSFHVESNCEQTLKLSFTMVGLTKACEFADTSNLPWGWNKKSWLLCSWLFLEKFCATKTRQLSCIERIFRPSCTGNASEWPRYETLDKSIFISHGSRGLSWLFL